MLDDDTEALIVASSDRALADSAGAASADWAPIEELGLSLALVSQDEGGFGIGAGTFAAIVRNAAARGVALPIGETMIANILLVRAGLAPRAGPMAIADAAAERIAWGDSATCILLEAPGGRLGWVERADVTASGHGLDGGARARLARPIAGDAPLPGGAGALQRCGAALRTIQMAGAASEILTLTVDYVNGREQFGRPLAKFQAIQQELARLAGQVAVLDGAAGIAADFLYGSLKPSVQLAAAKARASEAAGTVAAIAHQAHGAIGFTEEYRLGLLTKALWSWRAEFGSASYWQEVVATAAFAADPDGLWATVIAI